MKKFLAVCIGTEAAMKKWEALDEKTRASREEQGMGAWHGWMEKNKKAILDGGGPLGATKKIGPNGISDFSNELCGYAILQAESHDAAAKLFLNHPHFTLFPGDSIELVEILDIPS